MTEMTLHQHLDAQLGVLQKIHEEGATDDLINAVIHHNNQMHCILHKVDRMQRLSLGDGAWMIDATGAKV